MKILIGGDFAPTSYNFQLFREGNGEDLYSKELLDYLDCFDFRIYDFECVFEGKGSKIKKNGPILTCNIDTLPGILKAKPDLMVLANNHINNLGPDGVLNTIKIFQNAGIKCVGAGRDIEEASNCYLLNDGKVKVGVYACAEHEFNSSSRNNAGANPYDPLVTFDEIRKAKETCDHLIVFYHGGRIDYRYPLPSVQKALRKMIDSGADIVICQHTHCIGCMEEYNKGKIIYGQGDFLFARPSRNEFRYSGLLIQLDITKMGISCDYRIRIKPQDTIRLANKDEEKEILDNFYHRSTLCSDFEYVQDQYKKYIKEKEYEYLAVLLGNRRNRAIYRIINKITNREYGKRTVKKLFKGQELLSLLNRLECESHYNILIDCIKEIGENND